jgi:hypothetical protein
MPQASVDETGVGAASFFNWKKVRTQRFGDAEIELWHAFREINKLEYRKGDSQITLDAEGCFQGILRPMTFAVSIPPEIHHKHPWLAEEVHRALLSMNMLNTVSLAMHSSDDTPDAEREATLQEFVAWMNQHGFVTTVECIGKIGGEIRIKRPRFAFRREKPSMDLIVQRDRWVARAFEAMSKVTSWRHVYLYVGETCRVSDSAVQVQW